MRKRHSPDRKQDLEVVKARVRKRSSSPAMMHTALQNAERNLDRAERREKLRARRTFPLAKIDRILDPKKIPHTRPDNTMETLECIAQALSTLTDRERDAFETVILADRSYREAAGILGASTEAVRNLLKRGRQRLNSGESP